MKLAIHITKKQNNMNIIIKLINKYFGVGYEWTFAWVITINVNLIIIMKGVIIIMEVLIDLLPTINQIYYPYHNFRIRAEWILKLTSTFMTTVHTAIKKVAKKGFFSKLRFLFIFHDHNFESIQHPYVSMFKHHNCLVWWFFVKSMKTN